MAGRPGFGENRLAGLLAGPTAQTKQGVRQITGGMAKVKTHRGFLVGISDRNCG